MHVASKTNNKGPDQTVCMGSLVCTFVVWGEQPSSLNSTFVIRLLESILSKVVESEIPLF